MPLWAGNPSRFILMYLTKSLGGSRVCAQEHDLDLVLNCETKVPYYKRVAMKQAAHPQVVSRFKSRKGPPRARCLQHFRIFRKNPSSAGDRPAPTMAFRVYNDLAA